MTVGVKWNEIRMKKAWYAQGKKGILRAISQNALKFLSLSARKGKAYSPGASFPVFRQLASSGSLPGAEAFYIGTATGPDAGFRRQ